MRVLIEINEWFQEIEAPYDALYTGVIVVSPTINRRKFFLPPTEKVANEKITTYTCVHLGKKKYGMSVFEFIG